MKALFKPATATALMAALAMTACSDKVSDLSQRAEFAQDIVSPDGKVLGTLMLKALENGATEITVSVKNLSQGTHAMHFHETGLCEGPDFKSSGGHYNPTNKAHGMEMPDGPHAGDMMNIEVGESGDAEVMIINDRVSIDGQNELPALLDADGSALILHEKADDYMSQPSGDAGARIGCALITR